MAYADYEALEDAFVAILKTNQSTLNTQIEGMVNVVLGDLAALVPPTSLLPYVVIKCPHEEQFVQMHLGALQEQHIIVSVSGMIRMLQENNVEESVVQAALREIRQLWKNVRTILRDNIRLDASITGLRSVLPEGRTTFRAAVAGKSESANVFVFESTWLCEHEE